MSERAESTSRQPHESDTALTLLEAGVPLTLLLDLATPIHSTDVYRTEPGTADWLEAGVA
jgi:hypothetical protein